MRQITIFALSIFLLAGLLISGCEDSGCNCFCSSYDAEELTLNDTVDLRYNELYCNPEYELRLSFDSILDSRCPIGAICVWEGNAGVKLHVSQSGKKSTTFWLNTHSSFLTDTVVYSIRYELIDLLPYPEEGKDYSLEDYTLHLLISD